MSHIIKIVIFFCLLASSNVLAKNSWNFGNDNSLIEPIIIGNPDAEVNIIEYRSLTCSHCAEFASNGFEHLKEKYIDTGLISFELRPFPLNALDLNAFKLLYCASKENFYKLDKVLLKMGICEIYFLEDIPPKVTISEMVEISKVYSTDESPNFINGILDAVYKDFQKKEKN